MQPPASSYRRESMSESGYEIISNYDDESQESHTTDSLADSLDILERPGDITSLSGQIADLTQDEESDSSDDDNLPNTRTRRHGDDSSESARFSEAILSKASSQGYNENLEYSAPLARSIEFNETEDTLRLDSVSVKRTIRGFTDEETRELAQAMGLPRTPKRLLATIRQTMSRHYLSTSQPLRVLYIGSDAGRSDIMHKISSALLASSPPRRDTSKAGGLTDAIFNIVPISSFGSTAVPEPDEIQLMGVSEYFIKLEKCTGAKKVVYQDQNSSGDADYYLTVDDGTTYESVYSSTGSVVLPGWQLPHVAIFYLSDSDDAATEETRDAAWEFMTRHAIPSIFVSNAQSFDNSNDVKGRWRDFVDQGAVHMCLEPQEYDSSIPPKRFPIDLASFMNIDARQMNRNLAYVTGLHKPLHAEDAGITERLYAVTHSPPKHHSTLSYFRNGLASLKKWMDSYNPFVLATLTLFLVFTMGISLVTMMDPATLHPSLSTLADFEVETVASQSSVCSIPAYTPTVTIHRVSTKTVHQLGSHETSTRFGGFLPAQAQVPVKEPEAKKGTCSVQIYSDNEILLKIPARSKTAWLAHGAIEVDVWRGNEVLKSKLSTTDEGIILEIPKKDAHGVMNVSVIARKPKINESFAIDFGRSVVAEAIEAGTAMLRAAAQVRDQAANTVSGAYDSTQHNLGSLVEKLRSNTKQTRKSAKQAAQRVKESLHFGERMKEAEEFCNAAVQQGHLAAQVVIDELELGLRRSQIASRLWWLKTWGRTAEYSDYQAKANEFIKKKECHVMMRVCSLGFCRTHQSPCENRDRNSGKGKPLWGFIA